MWKMKSLILVVLVLFMGQNTWSDVGLSESSTSPVKKIGIFGPDSASKAIGLFQSDRLSFDHSLGMSFSSGAGGGMNQYYLNTITYKVAKPLIIQAQVGLQNTLSGSPSYGSSSGKSTQLIVPHFGVLYQPKPNLRIEFSFSNQPRQPYGNWGRYPY